MAESPPLPALPALVISGLFHPLLICTYIFVLLAGVNPYLFGTNELGESRAMEHLILVFLNTFFIPATAVFIMVKLEMVDSIMLREKSERIGPLLLVMVLYFWIFWNFKNNAEIPTLFSSFLAGVNISLIVTFVINLIDKISLHTTGMGGLVAVVLIMLGFFGPNGLTIGNVTLGLTVLVLIIVLLAGLVGSARLALKAHESHQIYAGYLVGFLSQFVALKFFF